jgi:hypothetical protein
MRLPEKQIHIRVESKFPCFNHKLKEHEYKE